MTRIEIEDKILIFGVPVEVVDIDVFNDRKIRIDVLLESGVERKYILRGHLSEDGGYYAHIGKNK